MARIGIVSEEFKEENYDYWKTCLQTYLVGEGLWDVVSSTTLDEKEKSQEWERKNAQALHAIQLACGSQAYAKYKKKANVTAKIAWDQLVELSPSPPLHSVETHDQQDEYKKTLPYEELYNAIENGDTQKVNDILEKDPKATTAFVSSHEDTPLHIAIRSGQSDIAQDIVKKMPPEGLEIRNKFNDTPLSLIAAITENTELVEAMLEKNHNLVTIKGGKTDQSFLPVTVASMYGRKQMVRCLYSKTPKHLLKGEDGVLLLNYLITAGFFDIASKLLNLFPRLGIMADHHGNYAIHKLAHKPSAFASGSKFPFWKKWIYDSVCRCPPGNVDTKGTRGTNGSKHEITGGTNSSQHEIDMSDDEEESISCPSLLHWLVPDIKNLHDMKLLNDEARHLLILIFKEIKGVIDLKLDEMEIDKAVHTAIKYGIFEFVEELLNYNPDFIWREDKRGRSIFSHAIILRQEKIFSLFYRLGTKKSIVASRHDIFDNNFLHLAAKLSPPDHLEHISGAALQMQRELQWYKEVERLVQPNYKDHLNESHRKPGTLFSEEHKDLAKEGQKWMKNTAGSCMVVGTLIAAVMFTTAFTMPGGNDDKTGYPVMLNTNKTDEKAFMIFIISNGLALFTSSTSILTFLGILTARYAEGDFLFSLPTKLIIGIACLFFSIVTMMISFATAMFLMLHNTLSSVSMPLLLLSSIPVVLFSVLEFPLLIEMIVRTYGATIFDKHDKHDSIIEKLRQCLLLKYRGLSTRDISNGDPPL